MTKAPHNVTQSTNRIVGTYGTKKKETNIRQCGYQVGTGEAQGFPLESVLTGADGHTPPPLDRAHTLIVADYVLDREGKKEFSYTIEVATPDGKKKITGVRPGPHWYRPDPRKPTYTVQVVMDKRPEVMTEEESNQAK